jgi:hypothetical protein
MVKFQRLQKELKEGIFEILRGSLFEVIKIDGEDVIIYKQLKITKKKTSDGDIYHIKDMSSLDYTEINNVFVLNLILRELQDPK